MVQTELVLYPKLIKRIRQDRFVNMNTIQQCNKKHVLPTDVFRFFFVTYVWILRLVLFHNHNYQRHDTPSKK